MDYPDVKREDVIDDYHGTEVEDPYRYMEDPEDPETKRFVRDNNTIVDQYLSDDDLDYFKDTLQNALDFTKFFVPVERDGRIFYAKQKPEDLQPTLFMREGRDGEEQVLLDINELSEDGTTSSVMQSFSPDGKFLAAHISVHGSDWQNILVYDIDAKQEMESLEWVTMSSVGWNADCSGFYYTKFPDQTDLPNEKQRRDSKLLFHQIGTPQEEDIVVFDPEDEEEGPSALTYQEGKYLFVFLSNSTLPENRLLFREEGAGEFQWIVTEYDGSKYEPIDVVDHYFYMITSFDADKNRIMKVDLTAPGRENWEEIIPESDAIIREAVISKDLLVVLYEDNVKNVLKVYSLEGEYNHDIELPSIGTLSAGGSYNDPITGSTGSDLVFFGFTSFLSPTEIYVYDVKNQDLEQYMACGLDLDTDDITTQQVFYQSKDGTEIPMYLIYRDGLEKTGNVATFLYGYGGFNVSLLPSYSVQTYAWVKEGGLFAIANLRGGGEFGKEWHNQALLGNKQNVFDDFISAGEYLIEEGYTSSSNLGINGRSNGGLLVGATMVQRPDLFGAAIPQVGVLDMLRFPVQRDAGRYWTKEYGNAIENEDHFEFLIEYSPYHNVEEGTQYPPTLVTAAESDDRVAPAHSKKFGAALQHAQAGDSPILVRIETKAGHGYGKPITKIIEDTAYNLAFFKKFLMEN